MALLTSIYIGRKYVIPITYKVNGVATDITGFTFTLMVKKLLTVVNAAAALEKDANLTAPFAGEMELVIEVADTDNIKAGTYYYDFVAYDALGAPRTMEQGTVTIETPVNLPP